MLGLKLARAARLQVGHIEAGLRSYNLLHPFPEELIRIYCMKRCDLLFTPSAESSENLRDMDVKGKVFQLDGNTVVDALRIIEKSDVTAKIPSEPYALAACHRLETIASRSRLMQIVNLLNRVSKEMKVLFVTHKPTNKYLEKFGLKKEIYSNVQILYMQNYEVFITLMRNATIVLADGGSIQEECNYLCKPCLILRNKTERLDGLGKNAVLWGFDEKVSEAFLANVKSTSCSLLEWPKPSAQIVDYLIDHYCSTI
jgi:UDP-N-acetylglucosamine 2-epimerase